MTLDRLRARLARWIAPAPVEASAPEPAPVPAPTPEAPLGLRAIERDEQRRLERLTEQLSELDPETRARVIAVAEPRRVGRKAILPRFEADLAKWDRGGA